MSMCYPADTDWGCEYTEEQLEQMRSVPETLRKMELSEARAWYLLASLCAYQIGVCATTIRPCAVRCAPPGTWMEAAVGGASAAGLPTMTIGGMFTPYVTGGIWVNGCGCRTSDCSCTAVSQVMLPGPVGGIEEVKVDGVVLAASAYRVDNGNLLVRQDGGQWPVCQDMSAPAGGEGTFSVSYYRGAAPNELTRAAAGVLAVEFYKACTSGKCRLPKGVRSVARGGATYEIDTELFPGGYTRIPEVDAVIRMYNPNTLKSAPRVLSPDSGNARRQTWGAW